MLIRTLDIYIFFYKLSLKVTLCVLSALILLSSITSIVNNLVVVDVSAQQFQQQGQLTSLQDTSIASTVEAEPEIPSLNILLENPHLKALLENPDLNAMLDNPDPNVLLENPNVKALLEDPEVNALGEYP
jgi:hypothetical protein